MKLNPCKNVPAAQMGPAVTRQLLAYCEGENGYTVNYMTGKKGAAAPAHSHPHLQVVYMIKGKGVFLCGEEEQMIRPVIRCRSMPMYHTPSPPLRKMPNGWNSSLR